LKRANALSLDNPDFGDFALGKEFGRCTKRNWNSHPAVISGIRMLMAETHYLCGIRKGLLAAGFNRGPKYKSSR
jgi:hypothetical protein